MELEAETMGGGSGIAARQFPVARFYEGPSAWTRSRNQHLFRVVTRDRNGLGRSCWIFPVPLATGYSLGPLRDNAINDSACHHSSAAYAEIPGSNESPDPSRDQRPISDLS